MPSDEAVRHVVVKRAVLALGVTVWVGLVGIALQQVAAYKTAPGEQLHAPAQWPAASVLEPERGRNALVMFVHPKCPCTRASLAELEQVLQASVHRSSAFVVFMKPSGAAADWSQTEMWQSAGRIPGVTRVLDTDGLEAERFGAKTSGQVVVYSSAGALQFEGGITESRGHQGDNVGRRTVVALLNEGRADEHGHAVFGCALQTPEEKQASKVKVSAR